MHLTFPSAVVIISIPAVSAYGNCMLLYPYHVVQLTENIRYRIRTSCFSLWKLYVIVSIPGVSGPENSVIASIPYVSDSRKSMSLYRYYVCKVPENLCYYISTSCFILRQLLLYTYQVFQVPENLLVNPH